MRIQGPSYLHNAQPLAGPHRATGVSESQSTSRSQPADELTLSPEAQAISQTRESSGIRMDRVAQIRDQIAAGTYETDEKLDAALSRMFDEIA